MEAVRPISKNVETMAEATKAFNRRDFEAAVQNIAENFTFTDRAQGTTLRGRDEYLDWIRSWLGTFSDTEAADVSYLDAGNAVIELYSIRATNDGPLGQYPATGKRIDIPSCEIWRFNDLGQAVSGEVYYDQLAFFAQLGHIEPPSVE